MHRVVVMTVLSLALTASAGECFAQGGLLARMNRSLVPMPAGVPTASPLGLIAPRLSNIVSMGQLGGMRSQAGRLAFLGILAPRVSPLVGMARTQPLTAQARRTYVLTMISPRATALVGMMRGARGMAAGLR